VVGVIDLLLNPDSERVTAIAPGQCWRGRRSGTVLDVIEADRRRLGRWIVLVDSVGVEASFSDDDIRGHYDLLGDR
jgi:hypothetical protein